MEGTFAPLHPHLTWFQCMERRIASDQTLIKILK
jgi:hypothetical protein